MKKLLTITAATLAASLASVSAHAASFVIDFVAEAAGKERGITNGSSFSSVNFGGLTLQFDATVTNDDDSEWFPYFDDISAFGPAGLGVCKDLATGVGASATADDGAGDDCDPSFDDNTGVGESIKVTLPGSFNISGLSFTDLLHVDLNASNDLIRITTDNGFLIASFKDFAEATTQPVIDLLAKISFIEFTFWGTEFYVNGFTASEVPIPGALPLLLSGIAGLGFASRRKKKA